MSQINMEKMYKVFSDFYILTKVRIVLIDENFNEVLAYPEERIDFCKCIRKNISHNAECVISDKNACLKCAATKEVVLYKCHAGLMEAVIPICNGRTIIGYVMFGQILPSEEATVYKKELENRFSPLEFAKIEEAIKKIPTKSQKEIEAIITVLRTLVAYVLSSGLVPSEKAEFVRQITEYIETNMEKNIGVENICEQFGIGKTRLYKLAEEYLGCGIAEYIRMQRIHFAKKLLLESDYSIADIANTVGFSDYIYFSKVFKQVVGVSASQYRKNADDFTKKNMAKL